MQNEMENLFRCRYIAVLVQIEKEIGSIQRFYTIKAAIGSNQFRYNGVSTR